MTPKPIVVLEIPNFYTDEQVDNYSNDFKKKLEGYTIIVLHKDINDINIKF